LSIHWLALTSADLLPSLLAALISADSRSSPHWLALTSADLRP